MMTVIRNINIRGCEKITSKKGTEYLRVNIEDQNAEPYILLDYDTSRADKYVKGKNMDFTISIKRHEWQGKERLTLEVLDARDM